MNAHQLKKSILQYAIEGKLVKQDSSDAPSSALLKQISEQKEKMVKEKVIKKEKPLPPITEEEIPFDIPDTWEWVRLRDVALITMGQSPEGTSVGEDISGIEFHQGKSLFSKMYLSKSNQNTHSPKKIANPHSIIMSVRAPVGDVNILKDRSICIGRGLASIEPVTGIDLYYLNYYLKWAKPILENKSTGSTFKAVNLSTISSLIVPLPPTNEQLKIVDAIEELFFKIDSYDTHYLELEALTKRFPKDLEKSILQYAIQGKLVEQDTSDEPASELLKRISEQKERMIKEKIIKKEKPLPPITEEEIPFDIPETWEWVRVGDVGPWRAGSTPSRSNPLYYSGEIPWIKTGELNDGYIEASNEFISASALKECSLPLNKPGSVLIAMYGATIGKVGILNIPATTNQACCASYPFEGVYNKYLFYYLLSMRNHFRSSAAGGAQPNISKEKLVKTLIPLPPFNEQIRIANKLDEILPLIKNELVF